MGKAPSTPPLIGQVLAGKYRIERVLGSGGMGIVVAATHLDLQEVRAIKLMHPENVGNAQAVERFLREARAAVRLESEHVARVLDVGRLASGAPYIVMEHLTGSDLGEISRLRGPLPIQEAALYVAQAASAIAEAHAAGVIHRDLKPSNLFLTTARDGSPCIKVLDFGISKVACPDGDAALDMTKSRELMGSPLFMAPELMRSSQTASARSDIWGLGVILYKLLTGRLPFVAKGLLETCMVVLERPPVRPSTLRPDLPRELEMVTLRCLIKDPARRLASAVELAAALAPFAAGRPSAERISVELLDAPEAPISVPARTTHFEIAEDAPIPVELVDEPDEPRVFEGPKPSARSAEHAAVPKTRRKPRTRAPVPPAPRRRRARGPMAVLAAVLVGIVGSSAALAGSGALVSRHQQLEAVRRVPVAPRDEVVTEPSPARTEPPPASSHAFVPAVCPAVWRRPATRPGEPDDPFRLRDPSLP
jgi:serine/threonine-protein kinase